MKNVGARLVGVMEEWAWHIAETNLRCVSGRGTLLKQTCAAAETNLRCAGIFGICKQTCAAQESQESAWLIPVL